MPFEFGSWIKPDASKKDKRYIIDQPLEKREQGEEPVQGGLDVSFEDLVGDGRKFEYGQTGGQEQIILSEIAEIDQKISGLIKTHAKEGEFKIFIALYERLKQISISAGEEAHAAYTGQPYLKDMTLSEDGLSETETFEQKIEEADEILQEIKGLAEKNDAVS